MMRVSSLFAVFSLSLLSCAAHSSRAQETGAAAKAPLVNERGGERNGERGGSRRAQNETRLRAMMSDFGIQETASQDALIAYLAEDEAGKSAVRGAARRLMGAVRTQAAPQRTRDLIAIYKAAIDADRERRRAAQAALDAKIGFSLSPRLEATLWLLGVLGEGQGGFNSNALAMRPPRNAPGDGGNGRDGNREAGKRGNVVIGVVAQKSENWIEVQSEKGGPDRYFFPDARPGAVEITPNAPPAKDAERPRRAASELLNRIAVGQKVRIEWMWNEGRRLVRLDSVPPPGIYFPATEAAGTGVPAANPGPEAAPQPAPPQPAAPPENVPDAGQPKP